MGLDKRQTNIEQIDSPRSVSARCFHIYDHKKNYQIHSILKRGRYTRSHRLRDEPCVYSPRINEARSPSEKILKIIMPSDILDVDSSVPSSFSPPCAKFPKKKSTVDYRELSYSSDITANNVRFHSKVLVMRIPSRSQYPESMKRNMWCSLSEIARSAHRNTVEYTSEGWDWRNAVEEDSMYVHPKTGQYIHPIHVHRAASSAASEPTTAKVEKGVSTMRGADSEVVNDDTRVAFNDHK
mmetsp:Transcript_10526/g.24955  ORF Transcript_10526/g.24955 Transcript_10526/m.24955 type:complete len:239 (-) Transcript_10526:528-1244(-)